MEIIGRFGCDECACTWFGEWRVGCEIVNGEGEVGEVMYIFGECCGWEKGSGEGDGEGDWTDNERGDGDALKERERACRSCRMLWGTVRVTNHSELNGKRRDR
jgi:hypothetical protein